MDAAEKRRIIEALILASPDPISAARLAELIPYCTAGQAKDLVNELNTEYQEQDRSFEVWEVAGGYQIRTRAEFSGYIQRLRKQRPLRLSRAALESLAIIAYRQPVTRGDIENVRGVETGPVVKSLLERRLVRIVGQKEVPGRPMLYGTSRRFLEVFGLASLKDMPNLRELDELAREHGLAPPDEGAILSDTVPEGEQPDEAAIAADLGVRAPMASENDEAETPEVSDTDTSAAVVTDDVAAELGAADESEEKAESDKPDSAA